MAKVTSYEKCKLYSVEYRNHSLYGNPSYWIAFSDSEGNYHRGYTASNAQCGYTVQNYRSSCGGDIWLEYHFTKKGTCIIDRIRDNEPNENRAGTEE